MGFGARRLIVVGLGKANHDNSVAAYVDGQVYYAKRERLVGVKHAWADEVWYWSQLQKWGIDLDKIDVTVSTDSNMVWDVNNYPDEDVKLLPLNGQPYYRMHGMDDTEHRHYYILDHHFAHAWSNLSLNSVDQQIVIIDGGGSHEHMCLTWDGQTVYRDKQRSPGNLLQHLGGETGLGGRRIDLAGKVMGLIPYGNFNPSLYESIKSIRDPDGDNIGHVRYGLPASYPDRGIDNQQWLDVLTTVNEYCFDLILQKFEGMDKSKPIIYSGGCALNVDWNRRLLNLGYDLIIEPPAYDGGLSLGCLRFGLNSVGINLDSIDNYPYIQTDEAPDTQPSDGTIDKVAELLAEGKIVGWYQGHGELGPRALGNRSILMNPTIENGKDIINEKVKHREWFRPFGASVKQDKALEYFDIDNSPYMLYTSKVLKDNLHSITHVDGTCRHQTVTPEQNELFYRLLDAFEQKTGVSVLLNTSLNLGGKPIAGTMSDAIELFQTTEMDALCLGNHLLLK